MTALARSPHRSPASPCSIWAPTDIGDDGARAIAASLTGLTSLHLSNNGIGVDGARAIASSLTGLTSLHLSYNSVGDDAARAIAASLTGLTLLHLSDNSVGDDGARAIAASLTGLTSLDLSNNSIGDDGARAIAASLTGLTSLHLSNNSIGDDGARAIAASLTGLTSLHLSNNSIGDHGARAIAASLTGLTSLDLSNNSIGDHGARAIAASLTGLTWLDLNFNSIGADGARAIAASLIGLTSLDLSRNGIGGAGIRAILNAWSSRGGDRLRFLDLRGNGDLGGLLAKEVIETVDAQAMISTYRSFVAAGKAQTLRPLNELKLLVVGAETVGKTSLLRYLVDGKPRDPNEARTPGILQHEKILTQEWSPSDCRVQLNVWDFGGQEMMRGTHRFFLTERSLYLLVLEDRRLDDQRAVHEWMKTIRNRGGDSPVLVVINKSDRGKQDLRLDERSLEEVYPNIAGFLRTSCDPDEWAAESIRALRAKIVGVILNDERLRHLRDPIPENWLQIKGRVRDLAKQRSVLTLPEFIALCSDPGNGSEPITDQDVQRALLQLFHHLGTIIAHGLARNAAATRREVSLLDPNWLTGAIYRILEKARTVDQDGEFLRSDLDAWLDPDLYPADRHEFILDMMQEPEVGLCFRLPDQQQRYLVPEALPAIKPFLGVWPDDVLRFRYRYSYLPSGLIPRLIVESHRNVSPGMPRWRNGVVLVTRRCTVLVEADSGKQRIDLQVDGPVALRRSALNVVLNDLETVHARNPEAEPLAVVPLTDDLNSDVKLRLSPGTGASVYPGLSLGKHQAPVQGR